MSHIASPTAVSVPVRLNLWITFLIVFFNVWQFFILPLFLLHYSLYWALTLIPVILATTTHWSLIHEAVHSHLLPGKRPNELGGRMLAIIFGSPFRMLRFGHLSHHRISRQEQDRVEVHDPEKVSYLRFVAGYYSYIFVGLYLIELVFSVIVLLPRSIVANLIKQNAGSLWPLAQRRLLEPRYLREMRIDGALVLMLFAVSFYCYGEFWPILAGALFLRGVQISVANASYHYGTPLEETRFANNFSLSPLFARSILNFNLHHVHHEHPGLPWNLLTQAYERENFSCDTTYIDGMLRQFRGPINVENLPQHSR